jgi:hypothetical protein
MGRHVLAPIVREIEPQQALLALVDFKEVLAVRIGRDPFGICFLLGTVIGDEQVVHDSISLTYGHSHEGVRSSGRNLMVSLWNHERLHVEPPPSTISGWGNLVPRLNSRPHGNDKIGGSLVSQRTNA